METENGDGKEDAQSNDAYFGGGSNTLSFTATKSPFMTNIKFFSLSKIHC